MSTSVLKALLGKLDINRTFTYYSLYTVCMFKIHYANYSSLVSKNKLISNNERKGTFQHMPARKLDIENRRVSFDIKLARQGSENAC